MQKEGGTSNCKVMFFPHTMIDADDDNDDDKDDVLDQSPHAYLAKTFIGHHFLFIFISIISSVDTNQVVN